MATIELTKDSQPALVRTPALQQAVPPYTYGLLEHFYDPSRNNQRISSVNPLDRVRMVPHITGEVYDACYYTMLLNPLFLGDQHPKPFPEGTIASFYAPLRIWIEDMHPREYRQIVANIQGVPDKEYRFLGDPLLHFIMPLQTETNQDMWVKIGRKAFREDLGFDSEGFWFPESAASAVSLRVLHNNNYKFAALGNSQLEASWQNPMFVPIRSDQGKVIGEMGVVHYDSELSGSVSYDPQKTAHTESYLAQLRGWNDGKAAWKRHNGEELDPQEFTVIVASDGELNDWHQVGKSKHHFYVMRSDVLDAAGFRAFNPREAVTTTRRAYTNVKDNTSWSCMHGVARWTGGPECNCGSNGFRDTEKKRVLYERAKGWGEWIDSALDKSISDWRPRFVDFVLYTRRSMLQRGDFEEDINWLSGQAGFKFLKNNDNKTLFKMNYARWLAFVSCIWFFAGEDRPERILGVENLNEIEKANKLLPANRRHFFLN